MQLIRHIGAPLLVLLAFIIVTALGFVTGGAGWIALSFLCLWPGLWAVAAWTFRGLRESYQLVPKQKRVGQTARNAGTAGQTLS